MEHEQIYVLGDLTYPGSPLAPKVPPVAPDPPVVKQAEQPAAKQPSVTQTAPATPPDASPASEATPADVEVPAPAPVAQRKQTRPAAVAGRFYPGSAAELARTIDSMLADAATWMGPDELPADPTAAGLKAMISPHAGYVFSGPVAASGYLWLKAAAARIKRVVLIGPAHYVGFKGIATVSADAFTTPLGDVPVDRELVEKAMQLPFVTVHDDAHAPEHGLEVHLPFLQRVLGGQGEGREQGGEQAEGQGGFTVAPFIFSRTDGQRVGELLELLWGGPETLILVSSDLSHFYNYDDAQALDRAACEAIEQFTPASLREEQACGRLAIQGLLNIAPSHNLNVKTLDLRNSGDTAGSKDRVVGYGSWVFCEPSPA